MDVVLAEAEPADQQVLAQLLEFNAYEFSRMDQRSIGRDGRFGYRFLDLYWSEPQRTPYLIWADGELGGFTLLRAPGQPTDSPCLVGLIAVCWCSDGDGKLLRL